MDTGRVVEARPAEVLERRLQGGEYLDLTVREAEVARTALPGQFVMIRGWGGGDPLLPRPFDVVAADPQAGTFRLVIKLTGRGTRLLERLRPGDALRVAGPLGRGLRDLSCASIGLLVRGVGAAAVVYLAAEARRRGVEVITFLSASTAARLVCREDLERHSTRLEIVTDDGSAGWKGDAVERVEARLREGPLERLYTCGSKRFARGVRRLDAAGRTRGFVFLEERMACGLGWCHGCAVLRAADGTPHGGGNGAGGEGYLLVCVDGPVFPIREVELP